LLQGNGTAHWASKIVTDFDNDGDIDAVGNSIPDTSNTADFLLPWYNNTGNNNYELNYARLINGATATIPFSTANVNYVADLDNDDDNDIVGYYSDSGTITTQLNDGQNNFTRNDSMNGGIKKVYLKDLNNDAYLDIVAITYGHVVKHINDGNGNFTGYYMGYCCGNDYTVYVKDLDNDGDDDMIDVVVPNQMGELHYGFRENYNNDSLETGTSIDIIPNNYFNNNMLNDANGDDYADFFSKDEQTNNVYWYRNNQNNTFDTNNPVFTGINTSYRLYIADFDNDSNNDIVINESQQLKFFKNDGSGYFDLIQTLPFNDNLWEHTIQILDMDNDGDKDILADINNGIDQSVWFENVTNLNSFGTISGYIWLDDNQNGLQDSTETGVEGISAILYNEQNDTIVIGGTNADGHYFFLNLPFNQTFKIGFFNQFYSLTFSNQTIGTNNGSDVNVITEQSEPFIFTPENNSIDIDAGIYLPNNQIGLVLPTNFEVMQDTININQPFDLAVTLDNVDNLMVTYQNVTFYLSNDTTLSSNDLILSNYNGYFFLTNGINTKNFSFDGLNYNIAGNYRIFARFHNLNNYITLYDDVFIDNPDTSLLPDGILQNATVSVSQNDNGLRLIDYTADFEKLYPGFSYYNFPSFYLQPDPINNPDSLIYLDTYVDGTGNVDVSPYHITLIVPDFVPQGDYNLLAFIDKDNIVTESNEDNNSTINLVSIPSFFGANQMLITLNLNSGFDQNGAEYLAQLIVNNINSTAVFLQSITFTITDSNGLIEESVTMPINLTIAANSSIALSYPLNIANNIPAGNYNLSANVISIDPNGNAINNVANITFTHYWGNVNLPNLYGQLYYLPQYGSPSQDLNIPYRIFNSGLAAAAASHAHLYFSADAVLSNDDELIADINVPPLNPTETYDNTYTTALPQSFPNGTIYVLFLVDADNTIAETNDNYNNNLSVGHIQITSNTSGVTDLMLDDIQTPTSQLVNNQSINLNAQVWNLGNASSPTTTIKYYLSTDIFPSTDDYVLGEKIIPAVLGNTKHTYSKTITIPNNVPNGNYYLVAYADANHDVAETNETNNYNRYLVSINNVIEPSNTTDLELSLTSNPSTTVNNYSFVTYTLQLTNTGNAPAHNISVDFKKPDQLAYTNYAIYTNAIGSTFINYNYWLGKLTVNLLNPNETVTVILSLYHVSSDTAIVCFAQVVSVNELDIDSEPNNNDTANPVEDDEALVVLNQTGSNNGKVIQVDAIHINNLSPNPATSYIDLNLYSSQTTDALFSIYDITGNMVAQYNEALTENINQLHFDIAQLPKGMYLIQSNLGEKAIKFVKF